MCGVHTSLQHRTVAMESSRARATDDGDSGRPRARAVKSPLSTSRLEHVVGKKRSKGPWFETVTKKRTEKKNSHGTTLLLSAFCRHPTSEIMFTKARSLPWAEAT